MATLTGKLVTPEMEKDPLQAEALGEKACKDFSKERLESDPANLEFHDTATKLKTFGDLSKKNKMKAKSEMSKEVIIKADRALFAQMLIIAENRKLKMKQLKQRINDSKREDLRPRAPRVEGVPSERRVNRFTTGQTG